MGEAPEVSAAKTVFVHVGAPKTGSTYLQHVLWRNREALAADGVCYPLRERMEHLPATFDLREMSWAGRRNSAWEGAWEQIAGRCRSWDGHTVVVSNELLGGATRQQAQKAVESLQPAEVHVVFTARDLARQLPSDWQEHLKHRHTPTFHRFVEDLIELGIDAPPPFGEMFWGLHDAERVLDNWSVAVPPQRQHVITVPQPGGPSGVLWERFTELVGLDPSAYDAQAPASNTSLGSTEAETLRRLNLVLGKGRLGDQYDPLVRVGLAEGILAARPGTSKIVLPPEQHSWVVERSEKMIAAIEAGGYRVVGDLDELRPPPHPAGDTPGTDPSDTATEELLDTAIYALAGWLERPAPAQQRERRLNQRITELERELETRRRQPFKTVVRDASERNRLVMKLRVTWWHLVERVRRMRRHP